ncbi:MAG: hypothetical protein U9N35_04060 [Euryarchaeota archaeon]|nr:hypothetical protein [Euryarchaeota archaeon]
MDVIGITDTIIETSREKYRIKLEKKVNLPQWLALFLEKEEIVEIMTHDNKYYRGMIQKEKKKKKLNVLDDNFYKVAEITIKKADTKHKKKLIMSLRELIDLRVQKLMKFAMHETDITAPHHEKILYNRTRKEIKNWFTEMEGIFNGDRV